MLRQTIEKKLREALNVPPVLLPEDFSINVSQTSLGTQIQIALLGGDGQLFDATIPRSKSDRERYSSDFQISCNLTPGELTGGERLSVWGLSALEAEVGSWAKRIAEDMQQGPTFRAIREQQAQIKDLEAKLEQYPDELPTPTEIEQIRTAISAVEQALRERIEQLDGDARARNERLDKLTAEFEALRDRVGSTKVRSMMRSLGIRLYNFAADPKLGPLLENGGKLANLLTNGLSGTGHK